MDPRVLVRSLEARWQDILDTVLREGGLSTNDVARLAPKVAELSQAYNAGAAEGRRIKLPIEARIAFSFPRDVPKGAAAVRELVASGALAIPGDRPLRVLDLGAGLGAMTWGLVRALGAAGQRGAVQALLVDEDAEVLAKAERIVRAARAALGSEPIDLAVSSRVATLSTVAARGLPGGRYDVVILGQVLSEIDPRAAADERIEQHASLVLSVLESCVADDGALVIVEPALRGRTRSLHAVRDRVLERARAGSAPRVTIFAPCLHEAPCPALAIETEWCHEDLRVDLPPWVVPIARAAGLRWQGLTFSYLVLRKDGLVPVPRLGDDRARVRFRAVSDLLRSKGKVELFVCGEDGARTRIRRLDRDAGGGAGASFSKLERGDIVTLTSGSSAVGPIDERGRVHANAHAAIDVGASRN